MADYCKAMSFKIKLIKINLMKQIAVCDYAVLQKLGHFNFSDWQIMHTTLSSLCWANVGRIYYTQFQSWAEQLVTLSQRWPNVAHIGQSWFNVGRISRENSQYIGPTMA